MKGLGVRDKDRTGTYPRTARESPRRPGRRSACPSAGPAWPGTAPLAQAPQLRSPAAAAPPPGIFSPRPCSTAPPPAPPQPGPSERRARALRREPLPARSPRGSRAPRSRRRSRTAEAPGGGGPQCRLAVSAPPLPPTSGPGVLGKPAGGGRMGDQCGSVTPHHPTNARTLPRASLAFLAGQGPVAEGSRSPVLGSTHACGPAPADADLRT